AQTYQGLIISTKVARYGGVRAFGKLRPTHVMVFSSPFFPRSIKSSIVARSFSRLFRSGNSSSGIFTVSRLHSNPVRLEGFNELAATINDSPNCCPKFRA